MMTRTKLLCMLAIAFTSPAWGAGHGHGAPSSNHGSEVSQAAHDAKANGEPVGPTVRDVARSNSQGPSHASANGIAHANSHSVLASADTTGSTKHTGKGHSKTKKTKTHGNH